MMLSKSTIGEWFNSGFSQSATHMIVVCDTFDYTYYPVYVTIEEDVRKKESNYQDKNMQKVMEVYNLKLPLEQQLNSSACIFNY